MPYKNREDKLKYQREYYAHHKGKKSDYKKKKYREQYPDDGYTYVYYIPEEHYVGLTTRVNKRMCDHSIDKITEGWEVLGKFEREVDAHWFETLFHMRGYNGHKTNRRNDKKRKTECAVQEV